MKIKKWDKRKGKKARFKRSMARARKRGDIIYGGFITISKNETLNTNGERSC